MSKATIDDVAELAGVSMKTVSRVVNQEPNVRASTKAKVDAAIEQLHYRPNQSARNLASQRTHLIVLIYDDPSAYDIPSSGYVIRMQQGTLRACREADYELLIHPCNYRKKNLDAEIGALIEQTRPAGIVLAAPLSNMPKIVRSIKSTDTPFVRLSPGANRGDQLAIATNDREVSAEMTRYLASLGHRRIAFIAGHKSHKAVVNRYLGYQDGLAQSGLEFSAELAMTLRYNPELKQIVFDHLTPLHPLYTGYFQFYGPDGSYDGLKFIEGIWVFEEDVDARNINF